MNRRTLLSASIVGLSTLSGCLSAISSSPPERPLPDTPSGTWTQYGANSANTFTESVSAPSRGNLAWTSDAFTAWQPVVGDGTVYITNFDPSTDGSAFALDAQDGTEQWQTTLNPDDNSDPRTVVVDNHLVVAHGTTLVALDTDTGERRWTTSTNGVTFRRQLVADPTTATVLLASDAGIEAIDARTGEHQWEATNIKDVHRAPAVDDDRVYAVASVDETPVLAALSLADGAELWRQALTAPPERTPPVAIQDGVLVVDDTTLVVHDPDTGDPVRELTTPDTLASVRAVAVAGETVVVAGEESVFAMAITNGRQRWYRPASLSDAAGLCVGTDTVIVPIQQPSFAQEEYTISAFDLESGDRKWYYGFDPGFHNSLTSPPVLVDGAVFFTATHISGLGAIGDVPART